MNRRTFFKTTGAGIAVGALSPVFAHGEGFSKNAIRETGCDYALKFPSLNAWNMTKKSFPTCNEISARYHGVIKKGETRTVYAGPVCYKATLQDDGTVLALAFVNRPVAYPRPQDLHISAMFGAHWIYDAKEDKVIKSRYT